MVMGMNHQWVADLGTKYLLTVVDALSKYAWVEPIRDKSGPKMKQAWENILKRAAPRHSRRLQTNQGKEFNNTSMQKLFRERVIHHFSTSGDAKTSLVERFNRTLKGRMYRYFTAANTLKYLDVLPDLVRGYNASYHWSIRRTPQDVNPRHEKDVWKTLYGPRRTRPRQPTFRVGD